MADLNDALFSAIERQTGDDIRPVVEPKEDNEMLKAILHLLTIMVKRMVDEPGTPSTTDVENKVVPFVS